MLWQQSAISGAIGGAISGGFAGGRKGWQLSREQRLNMWWGREVQHNRSQWSFFNSERPYQIVNFDDIRFVRATADHTCVPQTLRELEFARGGSRTKDYFKGSTNWTDAGVSMPGSGAGASRFINAQGFNNTYIGYGIQSSLNLQGSNLVLMYDGLPIGHMTTIRRINFYRSGRVTLFGRGQRYNLGSLRNPRLFLIPR